LPSVGRCACAPMLTCQTCEFMRHPTKCRQSDHGGFPSIDLDTNRPSACGAAVGGRAFGGSDFCVSAARGSLAEALVDGLSNCCGSAGKTVLDQPRSRSSDAAGAAVAVSCNAGCFVDLISAKIETCVRSHLEIPRTTRRNRCSDGICEPCGLQRKVASVRGDRAHVRPPRRSHRP
jgi:hypothetical protein